MEYDECGWSNTRVFRGAQIPISMPIQKIKAEGELWTQAGTENLGCFVSVGNLAQTVDHCHVKAFVQFRGASPGVNIFSPILICVTLL
jgi:hypothetical protein